MSPKLPEIFNNLPHSPTDFIGREQEIAEITQMLDNTQLLTLVGSGGSGKTRLAVEVASRVKSNYANGVLMIELASLNDSELVLQTIAANLGIGEQGGKPLFERVCSFLNADIQMLLLVLDNCEHILDGCSRLCSNILSSCKKVRILATSRERLNVAAERIYSIPALSLPDSLSKSIVAEYSQYDALRLFVERAKAVEHRFTVTSENVHSIVGLCSFLDGVPLAIELAATQVRVRAMDIKEILKSLKDSTRSFLLLQGGHRDSPLRHQTLEATIEWSYTLLNDKEKLLFKHLSVFAGGWNLDALSDLYKDEVEHHDMQNLLVSLVDKNLVTPLTNSGQVRYRMLETIRQYAEQRLRESVESTLIYGKHLRHYMLFAEQTVRSFGGVDQAEKLNGIEIEHDNLRQALASSQQTDDDCGLRLTAALGRFWDLRGYYSEGRDWMRKVLEKTTAETRSSLVSTTLAWAGLLAFGQGDYSEALELHNQSLAISQEIEDHEALARSYVNAGRIYYRQGNYPKSRSYYSQGLELWDRLHDQKAISDVINHLASIAFYQGDYILAKEQYSESLRIKSQLGEPAAIAYSLNGLANTECMLGNYKQAGRHYEESLRLRIQLHDQSGIASVWHGLANVALGEGDYAKAEALNKDALSMRKQLGDKQGMANSFHTQGNVAHAQGLYEMAIHCLEQGLTMRQALKDIDGTANSFNALAKAYYLHGDVSSAEISFHQGLDIWRQLGNQGEYDDNATLLLWQHNAYVTARMGLATSLIGLVDVAFANKQIDYAIVLSGAASAIADSSTSYADSESSERIQEAKNILGEDVFREAWMSGNKMCVGEICRYIASRRT